LPIVQVPAGKDKPLLTRRYAAPRLVSGLQVANGVVAANVNDNRAPAQPGDENLRACIVRHSAASISIAISWPQYRFGW